MKGNLYEILGLRKDVSEDEIEAAYKSLVMKNQVLSDGGDQDAQITLFSIKAAHDVLSDPLKREKYDEKLVGKRAPAPQLQTPEQSSPRTSQDGSAMDVNESSALTSCRVCGKSISRTAKMCPHCGESYGPQIAAPERLCLILGLVGALALFLGVFMPLVEVPLMGSRNYFQNGKGDGVIIIILAVTSVYLVLRNKFSHLKITGIASLAVLGFTFVNFHMKMEELRENLDLELAGNPFRGMADVAVDSVQLGWGWAILILGAVMLTATGFLRDILR